MIVNIKSVGLVLLLLGLVLLLLPTVAGAEQVIGISDGDTLSARDYFLDLVDDPLRNSIT